MSSNPKLSTFKRSKASFVISSVISPSPKTMAKSRTLLNNLLAILGVPLLRRASSIAASSLIFVSKTLPVLLTILTNSYSV